MSVDYGIDLADEPIVVHFIDHLADQLLVYINRDLFLFHTAPPCRAMRPWRGFCVISCRDQYNTQAYGILSIPGNNRNYVLL